MLIVIKFGGEQRNVALNEMSSRIMYWYVPASYHTKVSSHNVGYIKSPFVSGVPVKSSSTLNCYHEGFSLNLNQIHFILHLRFLCSSTKPLEQCSLSNSSHYQIRQANSQPFLKISLKTHLFHTYIAYYM